MCCYDNFQFLVVLKVLILIFPWRVCMDSKPFGLAVIDYSEFGIKGPYFGDQVWACLEQQDRENFERIPLMAHRFPDGSEKVVVVENVR